MVKIQPEFENESTILNFRGQDIEISPDNTTVVQYIIGQVAIGDVMRTTDVLDHIHIRSIEDNIDQEQWIFRPNAEHNPDAAAHYDGFVRVLLHHGFPFHANLTEVNESTLYAYQMKIERAATENSHQLIDELVAFLDSTNKDEK